MKQGEVDPFEGKNDDKEEDDKEDEKIKENQLRRKLKRKMMIWQWLNNNKRNRMCKTHKC